MTNRRILTERIAAVRNGETLSPEEQTDLLTAMVDHIGSPDPKLRDELVYGTLAGWIIDGVITDEAVRDLLMTCLDDEHLFSDIGNRGDNPVFLRSFSVLYVAAALHRHNDTPFLSDDEVREISARLRRYGQRERDLRGYVEEKRWAHAPAHLADALDELARCSAVSADGLEAILDVIREKTKTGATVYIDGEADRMVTAVLGIVERGVLDDVTVEDWVTSLGDIERTGDFSIDHRIRTNVTAVLGGLYCRSVNGDLPHSIRQRILETRTEVTGFE